jgi:hypothetical protein
LNVCMKERTQRRSNDLEQNTEKRKKLRGSCTYIQPESNSLGRYLVPRSTCEILSASTCAVTTARICKRRLCYRKQNGLSDHATKNLASAWICERKISLQNKNKSQWSWHTESCFDLSDDDSQLANYQKKPSQMYPWWASLISHAENFREKQQ